VARKLKLTTAMAWGEPGKVFRHVCPASSFGAELVGRGQGSGASGRPRATNPRGEGGSQNLLLDCYQSRPVHAGKRLRAYALSSGFFSSFVWPGLFWVFSEAPCLGLRICRSGVRIARGAPT
jgi:hypothetical protein